MLLPSNLLPWVASYSSSVFHVLIYRPFVVLVAKWLKSFNSNTARSGIFRRIGTTVNVPINGKLWWLAYVILSACQTTGTTRHVSYLALLFLVTANVIILQSTEFNWLLFLLNLSIDRCCSIIAEIARKSKNKNIKYKFTWWSTTTMFKPCFLSKKKKY